MLKHRFLLKIVLITVKIAIFWHFYTGPLTFREKVARYKLLKGAKLIQPSIPNISPDRYLEYFKEGTVDDAQADFLSADPDEVTFSQDSSANEASKVLSF